MSIETITINIDEYNKMKKENKQMKEENEKLKESIQDKNTLLLKWGEQEKISNAKSDLIYNLFSKIIEDADIDDGISISKGYGNKYIDEWNKIYEDIIKDTIKVMNKCELVDDGVYLEFNSCNCIEFNIVDIVDDECEEEDSD
tara:strand:- start:56 stop:484 length:429 start_codon:yes stop_codon:yes gene_type:complete